MSPRFMDVKQVADHLNMSPSWVYKQASRCGLTPYRFGSGRNAKIQFEASEVSAWIRQQKVVER